MAAPRLAILLRAALLALALAASAPAENGDEPLNHYGIATVRSAQVSDQLCMRFKARGKPVFLLRDLRSGLAPGDIMRFQDRAVLIDADVWQTLEATGALADLRAQPVVRVQAKATGAAWKSRAALVGSSRDRKLYELGAQLLVILEEYFGGAPARQQMVLEFKGGSLSLLAPVELVDALTFSAVRRVPPVGTPRIVSAAPSEAWLVGERRHWQPWAVDPSEPAAALSYTLHGNLPPGMRWEDSAHALQGVPAEPGRWPLVLVVRNPAGRSDSLPFALTVRPDAPPALALLDPRPAIAGQPWTLAFATTDRDHRGEDLSVELLEGPSDARLETEESRIAWTPGDSAAGTTARLRLRVSDPLGGATEIVDSVRVLNASAALSTDGLRFRLPWDSLVQGRTYVWEASRLATLLQRDVRIERIEGSDSTRWEVGGLTIVPRDTTAHELRFLLSTPSGPIERRFRLPVRRDRPPVFLGRVGTDRLARGSLLRHAPAAIDPEGDSVALSATIPPGSDWQWNGSGLELRSERPGWHVAELIARDPAGGTGRQRVAVRVDRAPIPLRAEGRLQGDMGFASVALDNGTGRIGLFTPAIGAVLRSDPLTDKEWPFLFAGGQLLGKRQAERGNTLYLDFGVTARFPHPRIATGGVMTRLSGVWAANEVYPGSLEFEFQAHIRQAMIIVDTTGIDSSMRLDSSMLEKVRRIAMRISRDAASPRNAVFLSRAESWFEVGHGFSVAVSTWREDYPLRRGYRQAVGGGLRHRLRLGPLETSHSLRAGWGGASEGPIFFYTTQIVPAMLP